MDDAHLYTPTTPIKGLPIVPMEVDGTTPRKIEAMELDVAADIPAQGTPQKTRSSMEGPSNDDFLHMTASKILGISLKPTEQRCVVLSSVFPDHPLLSCIDQKSHVPTADMVMEALDIILCGHEWSKVLFEEGSPNNCLQYLVDCKPTDLSAL